MQLTNFSTYLKNNMFCKLCKFCKFWNYLNVLKIEQRDKVISATEISAHANVILSQGIDTLPAYSTRQCCVYVCFLISEPALFIRNHWLRD